MNVDPVTLNVLISAFHSISEEMGVNLLRTARSTIIREARDCSCALLDAEGHIVAEAEHIPVQMSSLSLPMRACLDKHGGHIGKNEVFVTNDPFIGGQHLQDITIFSPIFYRDQLIGFAGTIAHHVDIGGGAAGLTLDAKEFYEEGLRFTAMKFHRKRDFREGGTFYDIVHSNFRAPNTTWGDLQAQMAANEVGKQRISELIDRYGTDTVRFYMSEAMNHSERLMRAAIRDLPDGYYEATDQIDDTIANDEPLPVCVRIEVNDETIQVDLTGSAPQVEEFLNVPFGSTCSSALSAINMALTAGNDAIPANEGCYRPITITAPYGSIVNPRPPAAVRARMCGAYRVFDAVLMALQDAIPDRAAGLGFHVNTTVGLTRQTGDQYSIFIEDIGGGWGGTPAGDGADMLDAPLSNCRITPGEALELDHPFVMLQRYELLPDTGGAGLHRGGLGSVREFMILEDGVEFFGYADRHRFPPPGAAGGQPGSTGAFTVLRQGEEICLPSKTSYSLKRGDVVRVIAGGGGGYGAPQSRAPELLSNDKDSGKATVEWLNRWFPQVQKMRGVVA